MSSSAKSEKSSGNKNRALLIAVIVLLLIVIVILVVFLLRDREEEPAPVPEGTKFGYTQGVTAVDQDSLQRAVDEMMEKAGRPGVALDYQNDAYSKDGKNFTCYIANSSANAYDMFILLYEDDPDNPLLISDLIRPGRAFDSLELDRELEKGDHHIIVVLTQVEEDLQTIHGQVQYTMDFHVS